MQVQQALLDVLGQDGASSLGLQDQFISIIPDDKIHAALCDDYAVVGDGDFHLALRLQATLGQRQLQSPLVVHLHAVDTQLSLHVNARADHVMGQLLEVISFGRASVGHGEAPPDCGGHLEHETHERARRTQKGFRAFRFLSRIS